MCDGSRHAAARLRNLFKLVESADVSSQILIFPYLLGFDASALLSYSIDAFHSDPSQQIQPFIFLCHGQNHSRCLETLQTTSRPPQNRWYILGSMRQDPAQNARFAGLSQAMPMKHP